MKLLEISAYRYAFRDTGPVIEFQYRDRRERILFPEFGATVHRLHDVDFLVGNLDALLSEKDTNAARIWGGRTVVNLHGFLLRNSAEKRHDRIFSPRSPNQRRSYCFAPKSIEKVSLSFGCSPGPFAITAIPF